MVTVLSKEELHLNAADGYKKTGTTVALNGTEDHMIVREAGNIFRIMGLRALINREVAMVNEEVKAGRLKWTREEVKRLIRPYPGHTCDKVIANMGEHAGHVCYEEKCEGENANSENEEKEDGEDEDGEDEDGEKEDGEDEDGDEAHPEDAVGEEEFPAVADAAAVAAAAEADELSLSEAQADRHNQSQRLIESYKEAGRILKECGALPSVIHIQNEIRKELRRQRAAASEHPAVADALLRQRDAEQSDVRKRRRLVAEANERATAQANATVSLNKTKAEVERKKQELIHLENLIEAQHTMKLFTLEMLGQGNKKTRAAKLPESCAVKCFVDERASGRAFQLRRKLTGRGSKRLGMREWWANTKRTGVVPLLRGYNRSWTNSPQERGMHSQCLSTMRRGVVSTMYRFWLAPDNYPDSLLRRSCGN